MRHTSRLGCTAMLLLGGLVWTLHLAGCGSSGGSSGGSTASGVTMSGGVSIPSDSSANVSAPVGKSVSAHKEVVPEVSISSLSTDKAVGAGLDVTITDAKTGSVLGGGETDASGDYSVNIASTATDIIIEVKIDEETKLSRLYTSSGSAASSISVSADTSAATVAVLQKCQEVVGISGDIAVSDIPSKCGAAISAGTLIPDAIYAPYLELVKSGVSAGSADASSGKGCAGAQGLMFREILSNKLRGNAEELRGKDPFEVVRKAYLASDSDSLSKLNKYAPTIAAAAPPANVYMFSRDSLVKSFASVVNDSATYAKFKGDPTVISKFYENVDATSAAKFVANPDDLQFQIKDTYDNKATDKFKDPKYFNLYSDACGDKNFSNLKTDDERKAYTKLIYNTDLSGKTADEAKKVATGLINTFAAACPSGTCDSTKLTAVTNNPTVYTASILAQPDHYGGASGSTYAAGLINQVGTTEVITGTKPTFTACATASDCGTAATGTFVCVNSFCQNSATAKATGEACGYNGDCISGTCNPVSRICTDPVALGGTGSTGTISGTLTTLLANGSSCLAGYQCSSGNCDLADHTCKVASAVVPVTGSDTKLGGNYKKGSSPSNILSASLNVIVTSGTAVSVGFSEGLYGTTTTGSFNSSTNKLTFSASVYEGMSQKTLTCTGIDVLGSGATLSGTDVCVLGGESKSINHAK